MSSKGKRYSSEFKKQVVEHALSEGHTISGTAKDFGLAEQTLRNWIQNSRDSKIPEKVRIAELEEELRAYKRRVADLEDTNEIFKKAAAIFATPNRK
ncbi:MAG: hypothetical protein H6Q67_1310 [Firmicutes bacterium]|nr:hypothetical protein [Bacillota bacterium]